MYFLNFKELCKNNLDNALRLTVSATNWRIVAKNQERNISCLLSDGGNQTELDSMVSTCLSDEGDIQRNQFQLNREAVTPLGGHRRGRIDISVDDMVLEEKEEVLIIRADLGLGYCLEAHMSFPDAHRVSNTGLTIEDTAELVVSLAALQLAVTDTNKYAELLSQLVSSLSISGVVVNRDGEVVIDLRRDKDSLTSDIDQFASQLTKSHFKQVVHKTMSQSATRGEHSYHHTTLRDRAHAPRMAYVLPLQTSDQEDSRDELFAILFPEEPDALTSEALKDAFSLTLAEARVVRKILAGSPIKEVSRDLQLSEHTVRTYLKRSFSKIGVHNQPQMIHRLQSLSAPLRR